MSSDAQGPRVLPDGALPKDVRLEPLTDLNGYFPFHPPEGREEWAERAETVRRQMRVALGLWPWPTKTPLNAVMHGKVERDDYTVEKVYFESYPGFYVTGSLYRPKELTTPAPGVLCPHGHWSDGRFHDAGPENVLKEIVQGAERFEEGGRSPLQARCVQLARMGCVVFHYDMIGYADSEQISFDIAHRFAKQREEMNTTENWGLYSPQAEMNLQNVMGLQTWSSFRALDFLESLPEVDPKRIAVTGASGGGTQTFILCALDDRPALAFPAVMVSTAMQGGCTCENASLLRVGTGNVEFAALFAPKPMGLTSADDWTREMALEGKGFPELKRHYERLGAPQSVMLKRGEHFGHNYNYVSRAALYSWVNKHFNLGLKEPVVERDYRRLSKEEMSVWNAQHPKPPGGPDFERRLLSWIRQDSATHLKKAEESAQEFRRTVGGAFDAVIGRDLSQAGRSEFEMIHKLDRGSYLEMSGLLKNQTHQEVLPIVFLYPKEWNGQSVIWLDAKGKSGIFAAEGHIPRPEVKKLIEAGATVIGVDLLFQGEFLADGKPVTKTRRVNNTREFAGYTFGYNRALFAQRVHDVLSVVRFVRDHEKPSKRIDLVGVRGAGVLALAAGAQAGGAIHRVVADTDGFRFGQLLEIHDVSFLPGAAKYGDVPALAALNAPHALLLLGEAERGMRLARAIYAQNQSVQKLAIAEAGFEETSGRALGWLLEAE